jgi:hypothetical protein
MKDKNGMADDIVNVFKVGSHVASILGTATNDVPLQLAGEIGSAIATVGEIIDQSEGNSSASSDVELSQGRSEGIAQGPHQIESSEFPQYESALGDELVIGGEDYQQGPETVGAIANLLGHSQSIIEQSQYHHDTDYLAQDTLEDTPPYPL